MKLFTINIFCLHGACQGTFYDEITDLLQDQYIFKLKCSTLILLKEESRTTFDLKRIWLQIALQIQYMECRSLFSYFLDIVGENIVKYKWSRCEIEFEFPYRIRIAI